MMSKNFTGWQWLLIDVATQVDDKLTFEKRIEWAETNLSNLESFIPTIGLKERPLYIKAVMAVRKAQKGLPMGHMVAVDAICSGIQIMSAMTGCHAGALATGLVDPDVRADAYTSYTDEMNRILASEGLTVNISRKKAKEAVMTAFYGSKATPIEIFGEDTYELEAFYKAATVVAPGAWELLQDLLGSWNSYALVHEWKLPDGFDVRVKVMQEKEIRIEVDELDHATFTYQFQENIGSKKGLSNAANCVHSVDAWVLRSVQRRCNYHLPTALFAQQTIEEELNRRSLGLGQQDTSEHPGKVGYYRTQYERSTVADIVIMPHINPNTVVYLSDEHLEKIASIIAGMLKYKPFPVVTVHDAYAAHPNNVNYVRWQYREILAEIADSDLVNDLLNQIYGCEGHFQKLSNNLAQAIRKSEYALC